MDTCSQLEDYVAGRLASADAQAFEAHAASCPTCGKAIARQQAVERAAKVVRRNQAWRETRDGPSAPQSSVPRREAAASGDEQMQAQATRAAASSESTATTPTEGASSRARNPRHLAAGVGVIVAAIAALVLWPKHEGPAQPESQPSDSAPVAPEVQREAQDPVAPEAPPTPPTPPAAPAPETSTAAPSGTQAGAPGSTTTQPDSLPLDTDIETLAQVVATSRCGPAVSPLRARVAKNASDARSWALLTQCYAKRKRWKNTLDAYDKVVEHGDPALVESLQPAADAARAALEAASNTPAAPAPQQ